MKKLLLTICLTLTLSILYAGGIYATGGSVTKDSASKTVQGGLFFHDDNLIVDSRNENWINPLFSSHFDMVFSGLFNDHWLGSNGTILHRRCRSILQAYILLVYQPILRSFYIHYLRQQRWNLRPWTGWYSLPQLCLFRPWPHSYGWYGR